TGPERDRLLGGARALLYPIQAPEPFGLVMVEAMMCGTPVATMRIGATLEIVEDEITGYCAESEGDFERQVLQTLLLDRRLVREKAVSRFSAERMAREYAQLYERLVQAQ